MPGVSEKIAQNLQKEVDCRARQQLQYQKEKGGSHQIDGPEGVGE